MLWMLNPLDLNDLSYSAPSQIRPRQFPLPWHDPWPQIPWHSQLFPWHDPGPRLFNPAFENLRGAWEQGTHGVPLPVAIYPTYVHARLRAQRSCFTIHGTDTRGLDTLLAGKGMLKRYELDPACRQC